jgi:hypothetical protein
MAVTGSWSGGSDAMPNSLCLHKRDYKVCLSGPARGAADRVARLALGFCLLLWVSAGCERERVRVAGSGVAKSETREIQPFKRVELAGTGRLELRPGPPGSIEVTADDNILPILETRVDGDRLIIRPSEKSIGPVVDIVYKAAAPELHAVQTTGAAEVLIADFKGQRLELELSGAGEARVVGETGALRIKTTGSSEVKAAELRARTAEVEIMGAGVADLNVSETLKVSITGAGTVRYTGDAKVEKRIIGAGTITRRD